MRRIPKIIFLLWTLMFGSFVLSQSANAQDKKPAAKKTTAKPAAAKTASPCKETKMKDGFTRLCSGLEYKIIKHGTGKRKPIVKDHIELNIVFHVGDSVIFNSRKMNNNNPVPLPITEPKFKGDPMEGFMLLVEGDSAVLRLPVDSMKKQGGMQPWMKEGAKIEYDLVLVSVRSDEEDKKFNEEQSMKQRDIDDKLLQEYFAKNKIKAMKTASGLYYTVSAQGSGDNIQKGQKASVNYTGKLLSGSTFDSNIDSNFHHVQPLPVEVGKGRVIKGWDEGLALLKKASKATFYIPSYLAYGRQDRPQIPANSILVFDVEILDVETPVDQAAADDKALQGYFAKNNIKATKTPSGLYYSITQKGTGENAKPGQKVSMRYTGKTLDGKVFDSNMDQSGGNAKPAFTFPLGQGQVIRGWDEGVQLLNMGAKGVLYIPSGLAYGEQGAGGGAIPANACLIFDVEVVGIDK